MNRRTFITAAAVSAASVSIGLAAESDNSRKPGHGACGLSCAACRMKLLDKCPGCGKGKKAECPILKCAQMKNLAYCAQCQGFPCGKIKDSGKFGEAWLNKLGSAPVPEKK